MGVINLTPNSFSNISKYQDLDVFESSIKEFDIIDIGAESTAPFNSAISSKLELERFEKYFLPVLLSLKDPQKTISIDTYKPEIFYEVALLINRYWPKSKLIFNDISGKVDSELLYLLSDTLKFDYILCHNLCPTRDLAGAHMDFLTNNIIESTSNFFKENLRITNKGRHIYADPCFGFSKSYFQNYELLKDLHKIDVLDSFDGTVIGISKKSFLRSPKSISLSENILEIEQIHSNLLFHLLQNMNSPLIVRSHSITPIISAKKSMRMIL